MERYEEAKRQAGATAKGLVDQKTRKQASADAKEQVDQEARKQAAAAAKELGIKKQKYKAKKGYLTWIG